MTDSKKNNKEQVSPEEDTKISDFNFVIPKFEDIPVSTRTLIVMTNLTLNIQKLYEYLPITKYIVIEKKRGRKKKSIVENPNKGIGDGSIITVDFQNNIRGVSLKKKKKSAKKNGDYFRNSVTIVMMMDGKLINFKISRNGKFQMTGCKNDNHAERCVKYIWKYISKKKDVYTLKDKKFKALFIPAMRNIDFDLGFRIDREKLDYFFNTETEYRSLLETSICYTGVNIKIPFQKSITELMLKELTWKGDGWGSQRNIPFSEYLDMLPTHEKNKKLKKKRYHTFLVFHSGKIIMSSLCGKFAKDTYYQFMKIIKESYEKFKEKLIVD